VNHKTTTHSVDQADLTTPPWREVFLYFLMLGFVNIGGPVAQITMMYNHMVERKHWLSNDRFVKIMSFCHMLPGPEALQLAIYVGYLKRRLLGGIVAGLTFIMPGAVAMVILSWVYVTYGRLPQVGYVLYVVKPAVLGIICAGIIKLGRASITSVFLAVLLVGAFAGMYFGRINFLLIMIAAGFLNFFFTDGWRHLRKQAGILPITLSITLGGFTATLPFTNSRWVQMSWLFLKAGMFSFGGAYASIIFLERGAVAEHGWLTAGQLLDGVALSVATPGPFMLFTTFVGYLAGGFAGAVLATFLVFLPSFVFVLVGARYFEQVRSNRFIQAFLAGASAAVVGIIIVVSLNLAPEALAGLPGVIIALAAFLLIIVLKVDVAVVAVGALATGITYAVARGLY
jgi:chromate transporter